MLSKSRLAIELSKLKSFPSPNLVSEQYATDSEVAADMLWNAYMLHDISGKVIADLGCGTGILGVGCLLLGTKKVFFVDNDKEALSTTSANINNLIDQNMISKSSKNYEIINSDISKIKIKADTVIQNPPFGTKQKHADREFLLKAFETANVVYSIHKSTSIDFVDKLSKDNGFKVTNLFRYSLPLKHTHSFHRKRIHRIEVACFRLVKA